MYVTGFSCVFYSFCHLIPVQLCFKNGMKQLWKFKALELWHCHNHFWEFQYNIVHINKLSICQNCQTILFANISLEYLAGHNLHIPAKSYLRIARNSKEDSMKVAMFYMLGEFLLHSGYGISNQVCVVCMICDLFDPFMPENILEKQSSGSRILLVANFELNISSQNIWRRAFGFFWYWTYIFQMFFEKCSSLICITQIIRTMKVCNA